MWTPVQVPAGVAGVWYSEEYEDVECALPVVGVHPVVGVGCSLDSELKGPGRQLEHDPGWGVLTGEKTQWAGVSAWGPWVDLDAY